MSTDPPSTDPHGTTVAPAKPNKKRFVPLENNPEVMTTLLHNLGLSRTLQFHDVF
ncbi:hypothetical protein KC336_g21378, partial [Hortaea werneckii]